MQALGPLIYRLQIYKVNQDHALLHRVKHLIRSFYQVETFLMLDTLINNFKWDKFIP